MKGFNIFKICIIMGFGLKIGSHLADSVDELLAVYLENSGKLDVIYKVISENEHKKEDIKMKIGF